MVATPAPHWRVFFPTACRAWQYAANELIVVINAGGRNCADWGNARSTHGLDAAIVRPAPVRTQTSVFAAEFFVSYFSVGSGTRIANGRIDCARFRAR
jgi:hypothetical protein